MLWTSLSVMQPLSGTEVPMEVGNGPPDTQGA